MQRIALAAVPDAARSGLSSPDNGKKIDKTNSLLQTIAEKDPVEIEVQET